MDNKVSKENIIYEDDETIVVLSSNPISKGHVIIQPKKNIKVLMNYQKTCFIKY